MESALPPLSPGLIEDLTQRFRASAHLSSPIWNPETHQPPAKRYLDVKNAHPLDSEIVALEEPHVYFLRGNCDQVLSVTTLVKCFFPAFDADKQSKSTFKTVTF